jgi:hypothetical protein
LHQFNVQIFKPAIIILALLIPSLVSADYLAGSEQLKSNGAKFSWREVESRSVKIAIEYLDNGVKKRAHLGSGFLISSDGLFITAYHVMTHCLSARKEASGFDQRADCSAVRPHVRYVAFNRDREYEIEVLSHFNESDSTNGKLTHTPDEIIKQRDFVIARLKSDSPGNFSYWPLKDFAQGKIDLRQPRADFELQPLYPPKSVFIAGYPTEGQFRISHGFLNLGDNKHRGYFSADYMLYTPDYLRNAGIAIDTKWGMKVENHMSGGVVLDTSGYPIGIVVNGSENTAGVLSIENILENFFSRDSQNGIPPALKLQPTNTPLYLRRQAS